MNLMGAEEEQAAAPSPEGAEVQAPLSEPTIQAYPWSACDKGAVQAANEIIGKRRTIRFKLLEHAFWIRFIPEGMNWLAAAQMTLRFGTGDDIMVFLREEIPDELIAPAFRGVLKEELPPELRDVVLGASIAPLLNLLGSVGAGMPQWIREAAAEQSFDGMTIYAWELGLEGKSASLTGKFLVPVAIVSKLTAALRSVAVEARSIWDQLPFHVTVEIGSVVLAWREILSLAENDIILADEAFPLDNSACLVLIGDRKITAKLTDNRVVTSGRFAPISSMANATVPAKTEPVPAVSLDDLPVRLSFTVGEAELAFHELKGLQEGYTFVLNRPVNAPVQIRAQGAIVGTGELLQVGDQIGVRVIELHLAHD